MKTFARIAGIAIIVVVAFGVFSFVSSGNGGNDTKTNVQNAIWTDLQAQMKNQTVKSVQCVMTDKHNATCLAETNVNTTGYTVEVKIDANDGSYLWQCECLGAS